MAADSAFEAHCERRGEAAVVSVAGEIDLVSSEELQAVVAGACGPGRDGGPRPAGRDVHRLEWAERDRGRAPTGSGPQNRLVVAIEGAPMVERLFDLTGLRGTLEIVPDPDAALAA